MCEKRDYKKRERARLCSTSRAAPRLPPTSLRWTDWLPQQPYNSHNQSESPLRTQLIVLPSAALVWSTASGPPRGSLHLRQQLAAPPLRLSLMATTTLHGAEDSQSWKREDPAHPTRLSTGRLVSSSGTVVTRFNSRSRFQNGRRFLLFFFLLFLCHVFFFKMYFLDISSS